MDDDYRSFIDTLEAPNTIKVVKSLQSIGQYDYSECTISDLEQIILDMHPNSPKAIVTICYVLGLYAKYLKDDRLYSMAHEVDKGAIWSLAKPNAPMKFISHIGFEDVYRDIGVYEDLNSFYCQSLFRCLYEGIYSDDMSVVKNLRASDIHGDIIVLHEDNGHTYDIKVSLELASDLTMLAATNTWERKNRYGIFQTRINGLYPDSCFKTESRKSDSEYAFRFSYYRILRKISKEYLEYNLLPLQLYISGIMYRIRLNLQEHNINLEDAFADQNRDRLVGKIISDELKRCNCNTEVRNFREIVKGHLDVFET